MERSDGQARNRQKPNSHPLLRLWRYATPHHRGIVLAAAYSVVNKLFDLAPPILIGVAVDIVVQQEDSILARWGVVDVRMQLILLGALTLVIWGFESIFEYLYAVKWRNLSQAVQHELRLDAYDHVQHLDMAYFEDRSTGGLMSVLNNDVNQLERFLDVGANQILQLLTTVLVVGGIFVALVPGIAWLAILPMPLIAPIAGGPNSRMALELALTEADTIEMRTGKRPEVVALNLIVDLEHENDPEKKIQERREALVEGFGIENWPIELMIEPARDGVVEDILRVARDFDQIIIGASEEGFLEQSLFGSIPQRIAEEAHTTVVMVKRHDVVKFGVRRWLQTRFGHRTPRPVWAKKPD